MEYGKFETLEQLLDGYNNLEKEFTKKCQALSELSKKATVSETVENGINGVQTSEIGEAADCGNECPPPERENFVEARNPENPPEASADYARIPDGLISDEDALVRFIAENQKLTDKIFELYLLRYSLSRAPKVIGSGGRMPSAPQTKPKNIEEASTLSRHFFK